MERGVLVDSANTKSSMQMRIMTTQTKTTKKKVVLVDSNADNGIFVELMIILETGNKKCFKGFDLICYRG